MPHATRPQYVKMTLHFKCACGHEGPLDFWAPHVRMTPAYTNESGTSWPAELEITCPGCGGCWDDTFQ